MNPLRTAPQCRYVLLAICSMAIVLAGAACQRQEPSIPTPIPWNQQATATAQVQAVPTATSTATPAVPTSTPAATSTPTAAPSPTEPPSPTPTPTAEQGPVAMTSPDYGIQAFLWWRPEVASRDLGLIRDMGFRWVKQVFAWSDIEGAAKDHFNWTQADGVVQHAQEAGIKLIARLDRAPAWTGAGAPNGPPQNYDDFGDFCHAMAERYRGRIAAYQIWNEPNLAREWGGQPPSPEEYTRLLSIAYRRIKEADPNAIVVSAGLSPTGIWNNEVMPDADYLERMYQAGFQNYADMVGMHAAGYKAPPEISPDEVAANEDYGGDRTFCFRHVEDLRAIMEQHGDGARRVVLLEFGWTTDTIHPSYSWHAVTLEQQADYLVRAYQYAAQNWQPWIALMSTIYIADSDWTEEREEYWWAITYPGYPEASLKPAYDALRDMPKVGP
ncbi:MAG: hypothetical protein ACK2VD_15665 [Anaerolineae bacterium]